MSVHVAIVGAAGMLGRKLTDRLVRDGQLVRDGRPAHDGRGAELDRLTLLDVVEPAAPADWAGGLRAARTDLADPADAAAAVAERPDVIVHLAAVVSGEAEADFEKGYRVNLDGTRHLLEAIRAVEGYRPRLVFASSIAVYGAPLPAPIPDDHHLTPLTSYGTQKAIGELLLGDYTRRGFIDGVGIRLPTICIRPGAPNQAASGFFSNILREPLAGREAVLPVPETVRHWHASPRSAVGFLLRAATIDSDRVGPHRTLVMPGLSATVGEQIEALRRVAGDRAVARIRHRPDPVIMSIVGNWATGLDARRARALGFVAEHSFDEIIRVHIDDELGGTLG